MNDYQKGFSEGFAEGYNQALMNFADKINPSGRKSYQEMGPERTIMDYLNIPKKKRKVKQSPKQKLLTKMTKVKWDKYKKGSGKKTYVEIRGEVSRSQKYKKACKRL